MILYIDPLSVFSSPMKLLGIKGTKRKFGTVSYNKETQTLIEHQQNGFYLPPSIYKRFVLVEVSVRYLVRS